MSEEVFQAIKDDSPLIAWIHNISLNQQKYMDSKIKDLDLGHNVRYIMYIHDNPKCSQDDLVNMFCQSKGNVAKVLKKLEDEGFIKREINPTNRRKYMLMTTDKGNELVPKYRQISKEWERKVGINNEDGEFKKRLIEIAFKANKINNKEVYYENRI
ncbi:MarR family winged helix-turn-helix transcriptional regulator [Methanobrevibacter sp.]|uniref:MarR family winged helix-turn-helix transcriptional regulator n=1 Tax=Methanobrevibacter sp. TaxID=66852 RepID=UPI0025D2417B|nr:MarR family winged helix-turn-helix transcriptional regulator [Methanobrevibacter sp.]